MGRLDVYEPGPRSAQIGEAGLPKSALTALRKIRLHILDASERRVQERVQIGACQFFEGGGAACGLGHFKLHLVDEAIIGIPLFDVNRNTGIFVR
ncbi:hypothetical protein FHW58_003425 [Duganella sp. 1224]|uniref:hypothetical protein n=1 Tax=Duganella sp. 1224 TaxID=2587052 RepID=UPI0015CBA344|nr:hypothetical protein [Duganella sp. 1224]NYE62210.1 hypothetical protein [Duganella sp. 1224]